MLPNLEVQSLRARHAGTPIETVSLGEAAALETALIARIGGAL
jgi:hypothetical protein